MVYSQLSRKCRNQLSCLRGSIEISLSACSREEHAWTIIYLQMRMNENNSSPGGISTALVSIYHYTNHRHPESLCVWRCETSKENCCFLAESCSEMLVSRSATCIHVFPIGDANTFYFQGVLLASAQAGQHVQPHQRCMDPWPAFFLSTPRAKACALMRVTLIVHLLSSQCSAVMLFYRVCDCCSRK